MNANNRRVTSFLFSLLGAVCVLLAAGGGTARAQTFQYVFGGPQAEAGRGGVRPVKEGGYVAAGESFSQNQNADIYVVRTDNTGALAWSFTYDIGGNDSATDIEELVDNTTTIGFVVCGVTQNTRANPMCTIPSRDIFIMRIDRCGNVMWVKTYGDSLRDEIAWDVLVTATGDPMKGTAPGDFVVAGSTTKVRIVGTGPRDAYLLRVDGLNGNIRWDRTYDADSIGRDDYFYSLDEALITAPPDSTTTHDIVAVGGTNAFGPGDVGGLMVRVNGNTGLIGAAPENIAIYDAPGNDDEDFRSVQELRYRTFAGDFIMTGRTRSAGAGDWDIWVVRTFPDPMNVAVERAFGDVDDNDEEGYCVREVRQPAPYMVDSNLIVTGYATPDPPPFMGHGGRGLKDVFLQEIEPLNLNLVGEMHVYGDSGVDWGWSVSTVPDDRPRSTVGYVVAGFTQSKQIIGNAADPQQLYLIKTDQAKVSGCYEDSIPIAHVETPWLPEKPKVAYGTIRKVCTPPITQVCQRWQRRVCYNALGLLQRKIPPCPNCMVDSIPRDTMPRDTIIMPHDTVHPGLGKLGLGPVPGGAVLSYPNPVRSGSILNIEYTLEAAGRASVSVYDITGAVLYRHLSDSPAGSSRFNLETDGWPTGVYLIQVNAGERSETRRIVVGAP
ncbi:MAG: hypothetical protein JWQ98_1252 [Chlorobi bacterium]|nr:hypothetical protein [Chlorobiota bacterium]